MNTQEGFDIVSLVTRAIIVAHSYCFQVQLWSYLIKTTNEQMLSGM